MSNQHSDATWAGELEEAAAIRISGADRIEFLQGQLTQDMTQLQDNNTLLAGWCSPRGRLIAIAQLLSWQKAAWLVVPAELAEDIVKRLRMFVLRSDVSIELGTMQVAGMNHSALQAVASKHALDLNPAAAASDNSLSLAYLPCDATRGIALADPATMQQMLQVLTDEFSAAGTSTAEWRLANIRAELPTVYGSTQESFVPQMLNLDLLDGINFAKGCYVGQEIVARTQNLGRIKRRMHLFEAAADVTPAPGDSIFSGDRAVGEVVDAGTSDTHTLVLGVVPTDQLDTPFTLQANGQHALKLSSDP
jgi:folate-binding protein YgfZ